MVGDRIEACDRGRLMKDCRANAFCVIAVSVDRRRYVFTETVLLNVTVPWHGMFDQVDSSMYMLLSAESLT
jgi:hypothetical protein